VVAVVVVIAALSTVSLTSVKRSCVEKRAIGNTAHPLVKGGIPIADPIGSAVSGSSGRRPIDNNSLQWRRRPEDGCTTPPQFLHHHVRRCCASAVSRDGFVIVIIIIAVGNNYAVQGDRGMEWRAGMARRRPVPQEVHPEQVRDDGSGDDGADDEKPVVHNSSYSSSSSSMLMVLNPPAIKRRPSLS
jgi:hypothetical protein